MISSCLIRSVINWSGVVEKKGAWLQFNGELIGQGKDAARLALVEKPELARKIVEGHQGILDFESVVGRDTTFIVKLPLLTRKDGTPLTPSATETSEP